MFTTFLIKYAEIGVKGKNRYLFEEALVRQIKYALKRCEGEFKVTRTDGRIYIHALSEFDFDETVDNLKTVFGISGIWARRLQNANALSPISVICSQPSVSPPDSRFPQRRNASVSTFAAPFACTT